MNDPWDDPQAREWRRHVRENVAPMVEGSAVFVSIAPTKREGVDPKFCVELGMAIMYNKPIVVVAATRADVPSKLWLIAESVLIGDVTNPDFAAALAAKIRNVT